MTKFLEPFLHRWRGYGCGLRYLWLIASSMRVKFEWCLEITPLDDLVEDLDLEEVRSALPGWNIGWSSDHHIRAVPPAMRPGRR